MSFLALVGICFGALCCLVSPRQVSPSDVILEGEVMRIVIDRKTGAFKSIRNKAAELELITRPQREWQAPWVVGYRSTPGGKADLVREFGRFNIKPCTKDRGYLLRWSTSRGPTVEIKVLLRRANQDWPERLEFWASVDNPTRRILHSLHAPRIEGVGRLGTLSQASRNRLAHSAYSGFLFDDPVGMMEKPPKRGGTRLRLGGITYPNGFGTPMQFLSYYVEGQGGFYFATHDPHHTVKHLDFIGGASGDGAVLNVPNFQWNERPGEPLQLDYPCVIAPLVVGDWFEGAELYRRWATGSGPGHPTWTGRGRVEDRAERGDWPRWLSEKVAVCTFGLPASYDLSPWLSAIDSAAGGPVFHVFGHDWPAYAPVSVGNSERKLWLDALKRARDKWDLRPGSNRGQRLGNAIRRLSEDDWLDDSKVRAMLAEVGISNADDDMALARTLRRSYVALEEFRTKHGTGKTGAKVENYFPTRLTQENRDILKANGDPSAPFHFNFFANGLDLMKWGLLSPEARKAVLALGGGAVHQARFMHPASAFYRDFHSRRGAVIAKRGGFESLYYDISASNIGRYSDRDDFGIPPGAGRQLIEAYRQVYEETRIAARKATGRYIGQGTEVMIENFLDVIDYGQWRVGGGVHGDMEGEHLLPLLKAGRARRIPMWSYVYHEYGGVRLDGWVKLAKRFGELFFYTAAQVALEGQILEINYEFSPLEHFPGIDRPSPQLHYHNWISLTEDAPEVDPAKLEWLGEATAAHSGFARDYLAWGRMVPSARVCGSVPEVELDWHHYNDIHGRQEQGRLRVPSLVHAAWTYRNKRAGLLFVNILPTRDQAVDVTFDLGRAALEAIPGRARYITREGSKSLPVSFAGGKARFHLTLPPRRIVLVELVVPP